MKQQFFPTIKENISFPLYFYSTLKTTLNRQRYRIDILFVIQKLRVELKNC